MADYTEGQVLTNKDTGEQVILKNTGKALEWLPVPKGPVPQRIPTPPAIAAPSDLSATPGKVPSEETGLTSAMDTTTGLAKAVGSGVVHDAIPGVLGIPGDIQSLGKTTRAAILGDKAKELEKPPFGLPNISPTLPGQDAIRGALSKVIPDYEPQGPAEEYAKTTGGFLPQAMLAPEGMGVRTMLQGGLKQGAKEMASALARYGVAPGMASESAGKLAEMGGASPLTETAARAGGSLLAPSVMRWLITPNSIKGATTKAASDYKQAVDNLRTEHGIGDTLMPSQLTNDRLAAATEKVMADTKGSGTESRFIDELNHQALTKSALKHAGVNAERATPDVVDRMEKNADKAFKDLTSDKKIVMPFAVTGVNNNQAREVKKILADYEKTALNPSNKPAKFVKRIEDLAESNSGLNKGFLTGEQYQDLRSQLTKESAATKNPQRKITYAKLRDVLDDTMENVLQTYSPAKAGKFAEARENWKNHLVIKKAVDPITGMTTPEQLMKAVGAVEGVNGKLRQTNPLARLARDAATVMTPLEKAGPANPELLRHGLTLAGVLAGGSVGAAPGTSHGNWLEGAAGGTLGALGGLGATKMGVKAAFGRPFAPKDTPPSQALFQRYRGNQLAPATPLSQNKAQQLMIMRALAEGGRGGEAPIQ